MAAYTLEIDPTIEWSNPPWIVTKLSKVCDLINFGFNKTRLQNPKEFGQEQYYFTVSAHKKVIDLLKEALSEAGVISDILQLPDNACEIAIVLGVNVSADHQNRDKVVQAVVALVEKIYRTEALKVISESSIKPVTIKTDY